MARVQLIVTLELEDESKDGVYLAREVYEALGSNYVFDVDETCTVEPVLQTA